MSEEWTVAIIKPDAVESGWIGDILKEASRAELYPNYMLLSEVSSEVWAEFYAEHKGKTFYDGLISHMSSGPCVLLALEGRDAIRTWRQLMGATNPLMAVPGSIRRKWGVGGPANAVHGSDSRESAMKEARILGIPVEED